jgi:hypothetical protein
VEKRFRKAISVSTLEVSSSPLISAVVVSRTSPTKFFSIKWRREYFMPEEPVIVECKKCGLIAKTSCAEYFCPMCHTPIVPPPKQEEDLWL